MTSTIIQYINKQALTYQGKDSYTLNMLFLYIL